MGFVIPPATCVSLKFAGKVAASIWRDDSALNPNKNNSAANKRKYANFIETDNLNNDPVARGRLRREIMDGIIYLVGLVVVVMAVLSFLGLH